MGGDIQASGGGGGELHLANEAHGSKHLVGVLCLYVGEEDLRWADSQSGAFLVEGCIPSPRVLSACSENLNHRLV